MIREGCKRGTYSGVEISGGKCSKSNEAEKAGEHLGENMARGREEKKKKIQYKAAIPSHTRMHSM